MSLDVVSEFSSQSAAQPASSRMLEKAESILRVVASGLAALVISATWVWLALG